MIEETQEGGWFCNICANEWSAKSRVSSSVAEATRVSDPRSLIPDPDAEVVAPDSRDKPQSRAPSPQSRVDARFATIEDLIARTGLRRDELATLAEIGALNGFGHDRRSALWQIERAIRPAGELFRDTDPRSPIPDPDSSRSPEPRDKPQSPAPSPQSRQRSRDPPYAP
jgi:hypothetical protein